MNKMVHRSSRGTDRWWESFYDDACLAVLADQGTQHIQQGCDTIVDLLQLSRGDHVLDQCCGLGQYSVELSRRGYRVTGVDQSPLYIQAAVEAAAEQQADVRFQVADALEFVSECELEGVFNWHSSFGYLPSDQGNLRMLSAAYRSLRNGGRMLLEYPNMLHLLANFQPLMTTDLPDGVRLVRRSAIVPSDGTLRQRWSYLWPNGVQRHHESRLRVYLPHQILEMLQHAGFASASLLSATGEALQPKDSRCIAVAIKES